MFFLKSSSLYSLKYETNFKCHDAKTTRYAIKQPLLQELKNGLVFHPNVSSHLPLRNSTIKIGAGNQKTALKDLVKPMFSV